MSCLAVHALHLSRGDRPLFAALDFRVDAGEVLHLLGRNGAGKTSLLETLCGLRQPDGGRIDPAPAADQRHWLGHRNGLNPTLSARENLRFWADLNAVPLADPRAALEAVGLPGRLQNRPCGQLSTGQKRRAALARLVAVPRPWWFLDEPLAGLDVQGLALFGTLLQRHVADGGACLVTSHQPLPGAGYTVRTLDLAAA